MLTPAELEAFYQQVKSSTALPVWFIVNYKTINSRNTTIQDWNKIYNYLAKLATDDNKNTILLNTISEQTVQVISELLAETANRIANDNELLAKINKNITDISNLQLAVGDLSTHPSIVEYLTTPEIRFTASDSADKIDTDSGIRIFDNSGLIWTFRQGKLLIGSITAVNYDELTDTLNLGTVTRAIDNIYVENVISVAGNFESLKINNKDVATKEYANDAIWDVLLDTSTYVMTFKDKDGNVIRQYDLPIEALFKNITYDPVNKVLIFTKQDGSTVSVPIGDLVDTYTGDDIYITCNNNVFTFTSTFINNFASLQQSVSTMSNRMTQLEAAVAEVATTCKTSDATSYSYSLVDNEAVTFTHNPIESLTVTIPNTVYHGFKCYISFKSNDAVPTKIKFINSSSFNVIRLLNSVPTGVVMNTWENLLTGRYNILFECNGSDLYIREEYVD